MLFVLDEFFRGKMRETFYETVDALKADLDAWLVHYNTERPHLGYRNMGRRPSRRSCHSSAKKVKWTDYQRQCAQATGMSHFNLPKGGHR